MTDETTKALPRRQVDPLFREVLRGVCIDLGGGADPLKPGSEFPLLLVERVVDLWVLGPEYLPVDAERIGEDPSQFALLDRYDVVYSSQCLEHVSNPFRAIWNWWRLLKVGGHLIITVPDESLYEQGFWPSRFNSDHKTTWRTDATAISATWGPGAIPLRDLVSSLPNSEVRRCEVVSGRFDFEIHAKVLRKEIPPVDQTLADAEAFIEVVARKMM